MGKVTRLPLAGTEGVGKIYKLHDLKKQELQGAREEVSAYGPWEDADTTPLHPLGDSTKKTSLARMRRD